MNARQLFGFFILGMSFVTFSVLSVSYAQTEKQMTEEEGRQKALEDAQSSDDGVQNLDPKDYETWKKEFVPHDVGKLAFGNDQKGCSIKMAFTNMVIEKYHEGVQPEALTQSKIIEPYLKQQYEMIREKGINQVRLDTMADYQNCMQGATPDENPSKAYDMEQKFGSCGQLNTIVMDTLESIKNRKKIDGVLNKYEGNTPDMTGTTYSSSKDVVPFMVGKLYKAAQDGGYDNDACFQRILSKIFDISMVILYS